MQPTIQILLLYLYLQTSPILECNVLFGVWPSVAERHLMVQYLKFSTTRSQMSDWILLICLDTSNSAIFEDYFRHFGFNKPP